MRFGLKFDKSVWMNFLHSFFGGIFGGIFVSSSLGQFPGTHNFWFYFNLTFFGVIIAIVGLLLMASFNYFWEDAKGRIPERQRKAK